MAHRIIITAKNTEHIWPLLRERLGRPLTSQEKAELSALWQMLDNCPSFETWDELRAYVHECAAQASLTSGLGPELERIAQAPSAKRAPLSL